MRTSYPVSEDQIIQHVLEEKKLGLDFVNETIMEITTNTFVDSIMYIMVDFVIDFALDSFTFGLWTIGKFLINIFSGGLGFF